MTYCSFILLTFYFVTGNCDVFDETYVIFDFSAPYNFLSGVWIKNNESFVDKSLCGGSGHATFGGTYAYEHTNSSYIAYNYVDSTDNALNFRIGISLTICDENGVNLIHTGTRSSWQWSTSVDTPIEEWFNDSSDSVVVIESNEWTLCNPSSDIGCDTNTPTTNPTNNPTTNPSANTFQPSTTPSNEPTTIPSVSPSKFPTETPTQPYLKYFGEASWSAIIPPTVSMGIDLFVWDSNVDNVTFHIWGYNNDNFLMVLTTEDLTFNTDRDGQQEEEFFNKTLNESCYIIYPSEPSVIESHIEYNYSADTELDKYILSRSYTQHLHSIKWFNDSLDDNVIHVTFVRDTKTDDKHDFHFNLTALTNPFYVCYLISTFGLSNSFAQVLAEPEGESTFKCHEVELQGNYKLRSEVKVVSANITIKFVWDPFDDIYSLILDKPDSYFVVWGAYFYDTDIDPPFEEWGGPAPFLADSTTALAVNEDEQFLRIEVKYERNRMVFQTEYTVEKVTNPVVNTTIKRVFGNVTDFILDDFVAFDTVRWIAQRRMPMVIWYGDTSNPSIGGLVVSNITQMTVVESVMWLDYVTSAPTSAPTYSPTNAPSRIPSSSPTNSPTNAPTNFPSDSPTNAPSRVPSSLPTNSPTDSPINDPTARPSDTPTDVSNNPTVNPTSNPTKNSSKTNENTVGIVVGVLISAVVILIFIYLGYYYYTYKYDPLKNKNGTSSSNVLSTSFNKIELNANQNLDNNIFIDENNKPTNLSKVTIGSESELVKSSNDKPVLNETETENNLELYENDNTTNEIITPGKTEEFNELNETNEKPIEKSHSELELHENNNNTTEITETPPKVKEKAEFNETHSELELVENNENNSKITPGKVEDTRTPIGNEIVIDSKIEMQLMNEIEMNDSYNIEGNTNVEGEIVDSEDISLWTVDDVVTWLKDVVNLPQYENVFRNNDINGEALLSLDKNELANELGIVSYGHKFSIMKHIKELQE